MNITPVKKGSNYRFRLGLQMFPMKTNEYYSLVVELYNRDYKTWQRQETYVNGTGMWVISNNTTKFQHRYGSSGDLYYTKTLIKFKKTSSSAPIFGCFTVHFDDNGGDMNTYPREFKNQVYIVAYGIVGLTDHVDSEVYDAHEAFEIDKTKMKMLVPLDMNGKSIMNTNFDLKFSDIFKIENFSFRFSTYCSNGKPATEINILQSNGARFGTSGNIFLNSIHFYAIRINQNTGKPKIAMSHKGNTLPIHSYSFLEGLFNKNLANFTKDLSFPAYNGLKVFKIIDLNGTLWIDFILIHSYM